MLTKTTYFRVLSCVIVILTFFLLISNNAPRYIGSPHLWAVIWVVSLLAVYPRVFSQKLMKIIIAYGLFLIIMRYFVWTHIVDWDNNQMWTDYYDIFIGASIISYYNYSHDYYGLAKVSKYAFIFIATTALLTIIALQLFGSSARFQFFGDASDAIKVRTEYERFGAGNYSTCIVFMSMLPIIQFYIKNNRNTKLNNKWLFIFSVLLFLIAILKTQLFTNAIIAISILFICFFNIKTEKAPFVILSIVVIAILLVPKIAYYDFLHWLSSLFYGRMDEISNKINDAAIYLKFGQNASDSNSFIARSARAPLLWDAFLKYPILGANVSSVATFLETNETAHLYWLHKLATTGIINTVFYVSIFYIFIKDEKKRISGEYYYYFLISVLSILIYGLFKVTGGRDVWYALFFLMPGLYYLPLLTNQRTSASIVCSKKCSSSN